MLKITSLTSLKSVISVVTVLNFAHFSPLANAEDDLSGNYHTAHAPITTPAITPFNNTYSVGLNKTEILRLPRAASAVLIGNPSIADVSIHSSDTIFVIGRSYGETNISILDVNGGTLVDANIQVNNTTPRNGVRVFYGSTDRETFNCTPYCAAAPILGDSPGFIGRNSPAGGGQIDNTLALGVPSPAASGGGGGGEAISAAAPNQ